LEPEPSACHPAIAQTAVDFYQPVGEAPISPPSYGRHMAGLDVCSRLGDRGMMNELLVGYARVSTEQQDLTAQRNGLHALGVGDDRIYVDPCRESRHGPPTLANNLSPP